jgi:hypothetical protein
MNFFGEFVKRQKSDYFRCARDPEKNLKLGTSDELRPIQKWNVIAPSKVLGVTKWVPEKLERKL